MTGAQEGALGEGDRRGRRIGSGENNTKVCWGRIPERKSESEIERKKGKLKTEGVRNLESERESVGVSRKATGPSAHAHVNGCL